MHRTHCKKLTSSPKRQESGNSSVSALPLRFQVKAPVPTLHLGIIICIPTKTLLAREQRMCSFCCKRCHLHFRSWIASRVFVTDSRQSLHAFVASVPSEQGEEPNGTYLIHGFKCKTRQKPPALGPRDSG